MFLSKLIPQTALNSVNVLFGRLEAVYHEKKYDCPACGKKNVYFTPLPMWYFELWEKYEHIHSIFGYETFNFIKYECSNCKNADRDRLYAMYIAEVLKKSTGEINMVDIGAYVPLVELFRKDPRLKIRTADLFAPNVDDKVDITNMTLYKDGQFDAFNCSHVLEHIDDDIKAMKELYRILKPEGWGIAMVPINLLLNDIYENPSIKDKAGRWKHFGQDDHVRIYSKQGFISRLESVGFKVEQLGKEHFGEDNFNKYGIHPRSVLYIVRKK